MKRVQITAFLVCTILAMAGCLDNTGSEPILITEIPSGKSHLSIANQSSLDLTVTYKITDGYGGLDSTIAVPNDSITKIFEPGAFGFPTPSDALAKLSFYNSSNGTTSPIFTVEPIVNENWDDVTAEEDTVTKYELVITEEDLK